MNSLFTSILSVLSLTELGISSALVYHMYKPIAEDDTKKICALLNFYRKTYLVIGIVTSFLGLLLMPLLPRLIKGEWPVDINIYVIYLIQLLANCISYFMFGYKQSLLVAYQREDIKLNNKFAYSKRFANCSDYNISYDKKLLFLCYLYSYFYYVK